MLSGLWCGVETASTSCTAASIAPESVTFEEPPRLLVHRRSACAIIRPGRASRIPRQADAGTELTVLAPSSTVCVEHGRQPFADFRSPSMSFRRRDR